jgi:hypothetical protein
MFNVLPDNLKKLLVQEYYVRVAIVTCILLLIAQGCVVIFLSPALFAGSIKKDQLTQQVSSIQQASSGHTGTVSNTITSTNRLLYVINSSLLYPSAKQFLDAILSNRAAGIEMTEFTYNTTDATDATISFSGVASTRNTLVSFVQALQNSHLFGSVNLPVSDLAHDTNITFILNISVTTPQPASTTQ